MKARPRLDCWCNLYSVLRYTYPRDFRKRFGAEMELLFRDQCREALSRGGRGALPRFFAATLRDWLTSSLRERIVCMFESFKPGTFSNIWNRRAARSVAWLGAAALAYFLVSATLVQAFVIPTPSMEGSLKVGDHILVNRLAHVQRGDLVAFRYPEDPRQTFVKRAIGLPGDRIRLRDRQVIRNGRRLVEPYLASPSLSRDSYRDNFPAGEIQRTSSRAQDMLANYVIDGDVRVPEGALFVLGDNRDNSLDSRYWGFVPEANIVGRPAMVYWSFDAPTAQWMDWNWRREVAQVAASLFTGSLFTKTRWDRTLHVLRNPAVDEVEP